MSFEEIFNPEWEDVEEEGGASATPNVPSYSPLPGPFCKHGWTPKGGKKPVLNPSTWVFKAIAVVHSPFKRKFGVPRQPGLAPAAISYIELLHPYYSPAAVRGLEGFSHIWLSFIFNRIPPIDGFKAVIRPPRLGGYKSVGVFATRSTHRPNPLGLSLVELLSIEEEHGKAILVVRGADLVDGTPIVDIKPYIAFVDSVPTAVSGFALEPPRQLKVTFTAVADEQLKEYLVRHPDSRELITQILAQDPRPAAHDRRADSTREYGVRLHDMVVRFRAIGQGNTAEIEVVRIEPKSVDDVPGKESSDEED